MPSDVRPVIPYQLWAEANPEPDLTDLLLRWREVDAALACPSSWASLELRFRWRAELGVGLLERRCRPC